MKKKYIYSEYKDYLANHIKYVKMAFEIFREQINPFTLNLDNEKLNHIEGLISVHDKSKYDDEEFIPYANHFFGKEKSSAEFVAAVARHKSINPHHHEYWVDEKGNPIDMPVEYIIEMFCDHWSFSLAKNKPLEILDYYHSRKEKFHITPKTQQTFEVLIDYVAQNYRDKCSKQK